MILCDKDIKEYILNSTRPLLEPFSEEQLQSASYDVSMSGNIAVLKRIGRAIDPTDNRDLDDMYQKMEIGPDGYLFSPGEYLLAELAEMVRIPSEITAHIRPRTRFTRAGILVADQHCNPTYAGRLYIGLHNASPNPVLLWPGLRIAQMVFEKLSDEPEGPYANKEDAAFQNERSFRGATFNEKSWSEAQKKIYQNILNSFDGKGEQT